MSSPKEELWTVDPEIAQVIEREEERQRHTLGLIASENFASRAVRQAEASVLMNKYAEGLPGHRYYGGCEFVDQAEELARSRCEQLFGAEHANVQPHSGAQANMAVYHAVLHPGDTVLGMNLSHGGHLTHGSPVNFSGQLYRFVPYGVDPETERIDYDQVRELAQREHPRLIVCGASAYPRQIDFARLAEIAHAVNAYLMADIAHIAGLVAAGVHPNPFPHADFVTTTTHKTLRGPRGGIIMCKKEFAEAVDKAVFPGIQGGPLMHVIAAKAVCLKEASTPAFVAYQRAVVANAAVLAQRMASHGYRLVSGGTDNHLFLVDLRGKGLTGREAERLLAEVGIVVNKNTIPFDPAKPTVTSGIRVGTPGVTTRGMGAGEMEKIGDIMAEALDQRGQAEAVRRLRLQVEELAAAFPPPA